MTSKLKPGLLSAYRQLLTPLVRILVRNGVNFDEFSRLAALVFVDVAKDSIKQDQLTPEAQQQIALISGIPAEQIADLVKVASNEIEFGGNLNRISRLLTGWHTDNEFTGPYGLPLELPMDSDRGPSLSGLIDRHCNEAEPRAMLAELLRTGVVRETEDGWYKVLTRTYLPKIEDLDSLERLGDVIANFVRTIDHNRSESDADQRLFERIVVADNGIRAEDLPRLRIYVKDRAQLLLEEIDNWLSQLDEPEDDEAVMTGLGIYHFVEDPKDN